MQGGLKNSEASVDKRINETKSDKDVQFDTLNLKIIPVNCLRATVFQGMNNVGYKLRQKYKSSHKNESSTRKRNNCLSDTFYSISSGLVVPVLKV